MKCPELRQVSYHTFQTVAQELPFTSLQVGQFEHFKNLWILFWTNDLENQLYILLWVWQNMLNCIWFISYVMICVSWARVPFWVTNASLSVVLFQKLKRDTSTASISMKFQYVILKNIIVLTVKDGIDIFNNRARRAFLPPCTFWRSRRQCTWRHYCPMFIKLTLACKTGFYRLQIKPGWLKMYPYTK